MKEERTHTRAHAQEQSADAGGKVDEMTTTTTTAGAAAAGVWVGCWACYNDGALRGRWFWMDDAGGVADTREAIAAYVLEHRARYDDPIYGPHEEYGALDHEGLPGYVGESVSEALEAAENIADLAENSGAPWDACVAVLDNAGGPVDADDVTYLGEFDSWKALAGEEIDAGLYGDIPEHLANYIDLAAIARDIQYSGGVLDAGGHYWRIY